MSLWHFIKRKFGPPNGTEYDEKILNRSVEAAIALLQGGDYSEARKVLLRMMEYEGRIQNREYLEWILNCLWITWERTEEYEGCTDFLTGFIARNPNHAMAHELRAVSLWYAGALQEAFNDYSHVLEWNSNNVSALSGRGQVLVERNEFGLAVEDLSRSLAIIKDDAKRDPIHQMEAYARNGLGAAYAGLGDINRSSEEFDKSIALCPGNAWVYLNRGKALYDRGD